VAAVKTPRRRSSLLTSTEAALHVGAVYGWLTIEMDEQR
jgi:hypothetical protein